MLKKLMKKEEGFTLAELLIVVAIIAVLVAISIPIFTSQLERSREATDLSNIRAAYAEAVADYLAEGATKETSAKVTTVKQTVNSWTIDDPNLYTRVNGAEGSIKLPDIVSGNTVTVTVSANGSVSVTKS